MPDEDPFTGKTTGVVETSVAMYGPYPEAGGEFCQAVREGDVIVDEFTGLIRGGA